MTKARKLEILTQLAFVAEGISSGVSINDFIPDVNAYGICYVLNHLGVRFSPYDNRHMERNLPELWNLRPTGFLCIYWFDCTIAGWKKRRDLIWRAIRAVEKSND